MITGVSPAHFTCTGMGATKSILPYWMRERITHESPCSFDTPTIVYLSDFSGPSFSGVSGPLPSLRIEHQRPVIVALVSVAMKVASNSACDGSGFGLVSLEVWDSAGASAPRRFGSPTSARKQTLATIGNRFIKP